VLNMVYLSLRVFNMVYLGLHVYGGFMEWLMRSMISPVNMK